MKVRDEIEKVRHVLSAAAAVEEFLEKHAFVEDVSAAVGHGFVIRYDIDTQKALNLFVKTLREHT